MKAKKNKPNFDASAMISANDSSKNEYAKGLPFDYTMAEKFLKMLDPNAISFTFQCFHPKAEELGKLPSRPLVGTLKENWDSLRQYNKEGYGVYVVINEHNGSSSRTKKTIKRLRAVWIDYDKGKEVDPPIKPSMVVVTSPGKKQKYYMVEKEKANETNIEKFSAIHKVFVEYYSADPNVVDITRVLRLPGLYNTKPTLEEPHLVCFNGAPFREKRYNLEKIFKKVCKGKKIGGQKVIQGGKPVIGLAKIIKDSSSESPDEKVQQILNNEKYYQPLLTLAMVHANKGTPPEIAKELLESYMKTAYLNFQEKVRKKEKTKDQIHDHEVKWQLRYDSIGGFVDSANEKAEKTKRKNKNFDYSGNAKKKAKTTIDEDDDIEDVLKSLYDTGTNAMELSSREFAPMRWAVRGFIPIGLTIVGGRPKVGKSFFCLDICASIATGSKVFEHFNCDKATALYASLEDKERMLNSRLNDMDINSEKVLIRNDFPKINIDEPENCLATGLIKLYKEKHPDLSIVIIDTLVHIKPDNVKNKDEYEHIYKIFTPLHDLAMELDIAIVVIHHAKKGSGGKNQEDHVFDNLYGSVANLGAADTIIMIDRNSTTEVGKFSVQSRQLSDAAHTVRFDGSRRRWIYGGEVNTLSTNENTEEIATAIKKNGGKLLFKEIQKITGLGKGTLSKRLKADDGQFIQMDSMGYYSLVDIRDQAARVEEFGKVDRRRKIQEKIDGRKARAFRKNIDGGEEGKEEKKSKTKGKKGK